MSVTVISGFINLKHKFYLVVYDCVQFDGRRRGCHVWPVRGLHSIDSSILGLSLRPVLVSLCIVFNIYR